MSRTLRWTFLVLLGLGVALAGSRQAVAGELAQPSGPVILEISGAVSSTNGPGVARFDLAMLQALDKRTIETSTNWTKGIHKFEGVRGKALLEALGATGKVAIAVALNDYKVTIPLSDFSEDRLILAYAMDDAAMSVRDKGPLWVMYDFDSSAELRTEEVMSRSIWQLRSIEFK